MSIPFKDSCIGSIIEEYLSYISETEEILTLRNISDIIGEIDVDTFT